MPLTSTGLRTVTRLLVGGLLGLLSATASAQHSLVLVSDKTATTAGGTTALETFLDEEAFELVPGPAPRPRKLLSLATFNTLVGDEDLDGVFLEDNVSDELNAVAVRPQFSGTDPSLHDLLFSSQDDFGEAFSALIDDGSLWRLRAPPVLRGDDPVVVFLSTAVLQTGLGTTSGLDIDAATFAPDGSLLLSFREDELILGDVVPLEDGGIVAFLPADIQYDAAGDVTSLGDSTARIALTEVSVDGYVTAAGLKDELGAAVNTIGDLQGLAVDPAGGTFVGEGGESWPDLLLCGADLGPRILTTAGGGAVGALNGVPLGTTGAPDAWPFGLDGSGDDQDFAALLVIEERDAPLVLDFEGLGLSPGDLDETLYVGNGQPGSAPLLLFSLETNSTGANFDAIPMPNLRFPGLYVLPILTSFSLGSFDASGTAQLDFTLPAGIGFDLNVVAQAIDPAAPAELSAPIVVAFDVDGP